MIVWSPISSFSPYPSNNCNCNRNYACIQQVHKCACTDSTDKMLLNTEVHASLHVKFSQKLSSVWGVIINFPEWLYCKYSCILTAKWEGFLTAVTWNRYKLGHPCWHCWELFLQIEVTVPTTFFWPPSMSWHLQPFKENFNIEKKRKNHWKPNLTNGSWWGVWVFWSNNIFFMSSRQSAQWPGVLAWQMKNCWAKVQDLQHTISHNLVNILHNKPNWLSGLVEWHWSEWYPWCRRKWQAMSSLVTSSCELPWVLEMPVSSKSYFIIRFPGHTESTIISTHNFWWNYVQQFSNQK
jgi:hypothetical protein